MTAVELRASLREAWTTMFANIPAPGDDQWALWLLLHDPEVVRRGVAQLAAKFRKTGGQMDCDYMVRFASSVMNRLSREQGTA